MNIGKWIVLSFVLFAMFIATLVVICVRQDIGLVSRDYYREELAYQDQIQRLNNTAALTEKPEIEVVGQTLHVTFHQPDGVEHAALTLFCPSNEKLDRNFPITSVRATAVIPLAGAGKGMYHARLHWKMHEKEYYWEKEIVI